MTEQTSVMNVKQAVPFFAVSNMENSLRFYVDNLGFEMTHKWIDEALFAGVGFNGAAPA